MSPSVVRFRELLSDRGYDPMISPAVPGTLPFFNRDHVKNRFLILWLLQGA